MGRQSSDTQGITVQISVSSRLSVQSEQNTVTKQNKKRVSEKGVERLELEKALYPYWLCEIHTWYWVPEFCR